MMKTYILNFQFNITSMYTSAMSPQPCSSIGRCAGLQPEVAQAVARLLYSSQSTPALHRSAYNVFVPYTNEKQCSASVIGLIFVQLKIASSLQPAYKVIVNVQNSYVTSISVLCILNKMK